MRFTLATVVFSLAAMVVAAPTNGIDARGGGTTCAFGQTAQCCSSTSVSSNAGLLGLPSLVDGLNCVPITILAAILDNPGCNQQQVCCPSSQGSDCDDDSNSGGAQGVTVIGCLPINL